MIVLRDEDLAFRTFHRVISLLTATLTALAVSLFGAARLRDVLTRRSLGHQVRDDGPAHHAQKSGTPTLGGVAIVAAAMTGYLAAAATSSLRPTPTGVLVLATFVGMAAVGLADDLLKLVYRRNLGLSAAGKTAAQVAVVVVVAGIGTQLTTIDAAITTAGFALPWQLPVGVFAAWFAFLLIGSSNAVNITDGLDGLAAGSSALVLGALSLFAYWMSREPDVYGLEAASMLDVAVICAAVAAACVGFLWHNAPPASIFMGDTGSLALGGVIAVAATATRTQLLLGLIGGLFVVETLSVVAQVGFFKATKGRRLLRMAPFHHHLELGGWAETQVIVRLWLITGCCVAAGVGLFYARYVAHAGL